MDGVDDVPSVLDADALADSVLASGPSGVDQPDMGSIGFNLLGQQVGVDLRLEGHESFTEAGRESGDGLLNSNLSTGNFGGVSRVEVVQGLLDRQLGNRGQH